MTKFKELYSLTEDGIDSNYLNSKAILIVINVLNENQVTQ
jgi:hypothetical protein